MIDLKTLRSLIKLMADNDLSELDIRDKDEQVHLKRGTGGQPVLASPVMHAPVAHAAPAPAAAAPTQAGAPAPDAGAAHGLVEIRSPMVGTFYAAPSPDAETFVRVGDRVGDDTVVCIIEAMKVFNEIKAETTGTIQKVLVASGQAVEFNQPLFLVKPD